MNDDKHCSLTGPEMPDGQDETDAEITEHSESAQNDENTRSDTLSRLLTLLRTGCWPAPRMQAAAAAGVCDAVK